MKITLQVFPTHKESEMFKREGGSGAGVDLKGVSKEKRRLVKGRTSEGAQSKIGCGHKLRRGLVYGANALNNQVHIWSWGQAGCQRCLHGEGGSRSDGLLC